MAPMHSDVLIVDVGRKVLADDFGTILRLARALILQKLLYGGKGLAVSLVLCGTKGTRNCLHDERERQYTNITNVTPLMDLHTTHIHHLDDSEIERCYPRGGQSDFVDALFVGLKTLLDFPLESTKSITMVSGFTDGIKPAEDMLDAVGERLRGKGSDHVDISMVSVCPLEDLPSQNSAVLGYLKLHGAEVTFARDPLFFAALARLKMGGRVKTPLRQTTLSKDFLRIGPMEIPVSIHKKIMSAGLTPLQGWNNSKSAGRGAYPVKQEAVLKAGEDVLLPEETMRTHRLGKEKVTVNAIGETLLTCKAEKRLDVLCFVPQEEVPRDMMMTEAYQVLPSPENIGASEALSALVRAVEAAHCACIATWVPRQGSQDTMVVALKPWLGTTAEELPDCFSMCRLPFAEDLRERHVPPPLEEQGETFAAADSFVEAMLLSDDEEGEALLSDSIPDPSVDKMHNLMETALISRKRKQPLAQGTIQGDQDEYELDWRLTSPPLSVLEHAAPALYKLQKLCGDRDKRHEPYQ